MLVIAFNWIYILFTIFCMGFAFSVFAEKVLCYRFRRLDSVLIAGLVMVTVYAQIFSLFYRVNVEANLCLILMCAASVAAFRKRMISAIKKTYEECSLAKKILIPVLFIVWCYFTSRGYLVPDTSLYHAQSIRWIEEYGVVKGLGNLNGRFAYNSSVFAVTALYSMVFLWGESLHAVNGLIAFILSFETLNLGKCFQRKKMILSDYARVAVLYYFSLVWDEVVAPSSDYAVMFVIFFIVIKWLVLLEDTETRKNIAPYSLLCVLGVYALTLKLSASLILILLIKPAYGMLKEKRWKEILIYLTMGILTAAPWMTRTVIISGWLFYPFSALDLFNVDWKMTNIGEINTDAALIKIWAKGANNIGINATFRQWFPNWFLNHLTFMEKMIVVGDAVSSIVVVIAGLRLLLKKQWEKTGSLFVLFAMMCCYLFWQFSAPMPRYGHAYILLLVSLTAGFLLQDRQIIAKPVYLILFVYGIYKVYTVCSYASAYLGYLPMYVWQQDYEEYDGLIAVEVNGVTIYTSPEGWITGYDHFPTGGTLEVLERIELRGDDLSDGFRLK